MEKSGTQELILLRNVMQNRAVSAFTQAMCADDPSAYAVAAEALLEDDMLHSFAAYLTDKILHSDNLFARRSFANTLTQDIRTAYAHDLRILQSLTFRAENPPQKIAAAVADGFPAIFRGEDGILGKQWDSDETLDKLREFHKHNGYGIFIGHKAFTFENGQLKPVYNTSSITLSDLKDYEAEKKAVVDNTLSFLSGLPLLEYAPLRRQGNGQILHHSRRPQPIRGKRPARRGNLQDRLKEISDVKEVLAELPFKFILFIDDLSWKSGTRKSPLSKPAWKEASAKRAPT